MLRITVRRAGDRTRFELEGRVAGAWVGELQGAWRQAATEGSRAITVNLAAVSYVDVEGKKLLNEMCRAGIAFEASGCLMRSLVDDMTRACQGTVGERSESHNEGEQADACR